MDLLNWMSSNNDLTILLLVVFLIFTGICGNVIVALVRAFKEK